MATLLLTKPFVRVSYIAVDQLQVAVGSCARARLCDAFAHAQSSIDAEFFSITDPDVVASLNHAAEGPVHVRLHVEAHPDRYRRGVRRGEGTHETDRSWVADSLRRKFSKNVDIVLEDHPEELMHGKAAVIDGSSALISTANPTHCGFANPGEVLVIDANPADVRAVAASIEHQPPTRGDFVISGPAPGVRAGIAQVFDARGDLRIASEDFSDDQVVEKLVERKAAGHNDRILLQRCCESVSEKRAVARLERAGVVVHFISHEFMHEKYVDGGDQIYVGSANLTRNGLDESREVGIVAPQSAMPAGAQLLRADFEANWKRSSVN